MERAGEKLYAFASNDSVNRWDYLGLVDVEHRAPDPTKVVPEYSGFEAVSVGLPWNKRQGKQIGGRTTYVARPVSCTCSCPDPQASGRRWTMECKVEWTARITLNRNWDAEKLPGAYGHEQKHVRSRKAIVEKRVVRPLEGRNGLFGARNRCEQVARDYERQYTAELRAALDDQKNNHAGGDAGYVNEESPVWGQPYDPMPGSPTIHPPN